MVPLTGNAIKVLRSRYLLKDDEGRVVETPEEMFRRVSGFVAEAEKGYGKGRALWEDRFFEIMSSGRFLPNSPTLMNAGKDIGQLAACFVLPVEDSMLGIFNTLRDAALILQSGGGTGFAFSHLRPREDIVHSTGGMASGPVSFMKIYNTATDVIKQGGARRGANMGMLRVDHPDIVEFIRSKKDVDEFLNFNISVAVTDGFIRAVKNGSRYSMKNPRTGQKAGTLDAKAVFNELVDSAWLTGDPGIVFIDRVNRDNPTPGLGEIESTNPCGEQPLLPYEACILGSLDLSKYVKGSFLDSEGEEPYIDHDSLERDICTAIRFLDDCIDVNKYPLKEIEEMHRGNRKIGLGVMGLADMLVLMGVPYRSLEATALARKIMQFINRVSKRESSFLAGSRGPFPNFSGSIYDKRGMPLLRNATTTTVAPTGTLSLIADCSSGIEPYFALAYKRAVLETKITVSNKYLFTLARKKGFYSKGLRQHVMEHGTLKGVKKVPEKIKRLFMTAHELHYKDHIEMQAAFQKYTDNAVSKTVNMPHSSKRGDVARAFMLAYEKGCKGITVFRSGGARKGAIARIADTD
ncbi:MAG: adenosylcobalamin-dependent ribonucleoside-diphosphate reductase [Nitrospirota bacterium]|nr:MAG: adenosylcobalamin-dependent ribonucleoside-diphosphate reductase [Nitrospirota bacterium]